MEGERLELDRMHHERLHGLRTREEDLMERLRRQQRDVENAAFEHRQKILREEERVRAWKAETTAAADARQVGGMRVWGGLWGRGRVRAWKAEAEATVMGRPTGAAY